MENLFEYGVTAAVLGWLMFWVTTRLDRILEILVKLTAAMTVLARANEKAMDRLERGRHPRASTDVEDIMDEEIRK